MRKHLTDKEIKETLKRLTIICDSREQKNAHVTDYFDEKKISYITRKLDVGDYSFQCDGITYENEIAIEKKNSIDEIAANFTTDRHRFESEFLRAKASGTKVFLFIENASWEAIDEHRYQSQLSPKALKASLLSWQAKYNITVNFCKSESIAAHIYATLYYWLKMRLEGR